jgi:indolepyruvate ferredoxin oxidoreductase beta subunit
VSEGFDVKLSEVHGMSQRGGSVVTYVRYGDKVYSPIVDAGHADLIVSFELLEAARWASYLAPGGRIVTTTQKIDPMPVIIGAAEYPQDLKGKLRAAGAEFDAFDALAVAERAGNTKTANVALMGRASRYFGFGEEKWLAALTAVTPLKFLEVNKKAFKLGRA